MCPQTTTQLIGLLAARSHGVVTRSQLVRAGITLDEIRHRVRTGALLREHRGVYRVGHRAPSLEARYVAATLACGEGACLSGRAAAHLYGLLKGAAPPPEVTAPLKRRVAGVTVRRARLDPHDTTTYRAIPITTVPRTLTDLAAHLPLDALARALHEAGVKFKTTPAQVEAVLQRRPGCPGAPNLRKIIHGDAPITLSALEKRFLERLKHARLPLPSTNRRAGSHYVDCRWPTHRLTVELDSYRFHSSRHAWEQDRRRDREARARGDELRRYTYADVFEQPDPMLAELHTLLAA
jgi:very-short-patch-repair endonuclease